MDAVSLLARESLPFLNALPRGTGALGQAHQARFEHPLLRFIPGVNRLISLSAPVGGDGETVQRQGLRGGGAEPYQALHGAGLRFVADLGAAETSFAIIGTGQSGHPMSAHWGDLLEAWRIGGMRRLGREPAQISATIRLAPGP